MNLENSINFSTRWWSTDYLVGRIVRPIYLAGIIFPNGKSIQRPLSIIFNVAAG